MLPMTTFTSFAVYLFNSPVGRALLNACNVLFVVLITGEVAMWVFGDLTVPNVALTVVCVCLVGELLVIAADRIAARFTAGACADVDVCPRGCCVAGSKADGETQT